MVRRSGRQSSGDDVVIEAAWLYYHDGLNQGDIAERLQLSRATVVKYLQDARDRDLVEIKLARSAFTGHRLAIELTAKLGLKAAYVLPDGEGDRAAVGDRVVRGAADWLPHLLSPGDRLGVAWGKTIYDVAENIDRTSVPDLTVLQLVGSMTTPYGFSADVCSSNIARKLSAGCINLHMPAVLSSAKLAALLREEPLIAGQLDAINHCNKTLFAAGSVQQDSHIVSSGVATADDLTWYLDHGAVGVLCGRFIDARGKPVHGPLDKRMLGIELDQMTGRDMGLLVAVEVGRATPAAAAIRGGYVTHLVTSESCAEDILAIAGSD